MHAAAADRRRDDVARAHGGEDRAALRAASPSTCPTRRAPSASRATCCRTEHARRATSREVAADYETVRAQHAAQEGPDAGCPRRGARECVRRGLGGLRPAGADVHRAARVPRTPISPRSRSYIDWGPFFQAWELSGPYPAILDDPLVGEAARSLYAEGKAMLAAHRRRALAHRERRRRASGRRIPMATTSCSGPTRRARVSALDLAQPAPAERAAARASRTTASPISSRRRTRACAITSARSPSPPASASRNASRSSRRRTTTTARSC